MIHKFTVALFGALLAALLSVGAFADQFYVPFGASRWIGPDGTQYTPDSNGLLTITDPATITQARRQGLVPYGLLAQDAATINGVVVGLHQGLISQIYRVDALGDSITANCNRGATVSALTNSSGIMSVTSSSAHVGYNTTKFYIADSTGTIQDTYASHLWTMGSGTTATVVNNVAFPYTEVSPATSTGTITLYNLSASSDTDWLIWASSLSNGTITRGAPIGFPGQTSAYVLAHMGAVLEDHPNAVVVLVGTNDVLASIPPATTLANIQAIETELLSAGITPILATIPPINNTVAGWTTTVRANGLLLNQLIRNEVASRKDVLGVDFYADLINPTDTNGNYIAADTADGKHPIGSGIYAMGLDLKNALSAAGKIRSNPVRYAYSTVESYGTSSVVPQLNDNPLGTGTAGTAIAPATGTVITGWTLTAIGTATVSGTAPARSDGFGNNQEVALTCAAAGDGFSLTGTSYAGRVSSGKVAGFAEVKITGATNLKWARNYFNLTSGGITANPAFSNPGSNVIDNTNKTFMAVIPEMGIPALTTVQEVFTFACSAAGGATVDIGRIAIPTYQ